VKRHSISWKVTEHVPHHAGVGSGWFGQRHFISFYSMLHAAARLVAQWLSEHIMFVYRISKAAWHNVHHDVAWFWYLFACLLENLAVESSAAWVPHIVAAPVLWTHQVENQGDHANWSLRLSTQHGIYQQLHILHHLYVHYLYNRSIHRQNIMKCEYMMIYECTVCVERLTTRHLPNPRSVLLGLRPPSAPVVESSVAIEGHVAMVDMLHPMTSAPSGLCPWYINSIYSFKKKHIYINRYLDIQCSGCMG